MGLGQTSGFVVWHRKIAGSWIWQLPPGQWKVAFAIPTWANWSEATWFDGHRNVRIQRGELVTSQDHLATFCGVSRKVVRTTLAKLAAAGFIEVDTRKGQPFTRITIPNYEPYQNLAALAGQAMGHARANEGTSGGTTSEPLTINHEPTESTSSPPPLQLQLGTEPERPSPPKAKRSEQTLADEVIPHLNRKLGSRYKSTSKATLDDLRVLVREKFTTAQVVAVIDAKFTEWSGTDRAQNLRPSTLFRPSNFRRYAADLDGAPTVPAKASGLPPRCQDWNKPR